MAISAAFSTWAGVPPGIQPRHQATIELALPTSPDTTTAALRNRCILLGERADAPQPSTENGLPVPRCSSW